MKWKPILRLYYDYITIYYETAVKPTLYLWCFNPCQNYLFWVSRSIPNGCQNGMPNGIKGAAGTKGTRVPISSYKCHRCCDFQTSVLPKVPTVPEVLPKVPRAPSVHKVKVPKVPKVPKALLVPLVPRVPKVPKPPKAPKVPKAPQPPKVPEVPKVWALGGRRPEIHFCITTYYDLLRKWMAATSRISGARSWSWILPPDACLGHVPGKVLVPCQVPGQVGGLQV